MSPALAGGFFSTGATWGAQWGLLHMNNLPAEVFGVWALSIHPAGGGLRLHGGAVSEASLLERGLP